MVITGILTHVFVKIVFKYIADTSVTECDKIIFVIDNAPTKTTNAIAKKGQIL